MECVETIPSQKVRGKESESDEEPKREMDPKILLADLKASLEYVEILKEALTEAYTEVAEKHHHHQQDTSHEYHYLEEDEFVLTLLVK